MEVEKYVARYNPEMFDGSIIPIKVIKETEEFVIFKDEVKQQDRMKKITEFHQVFDFFQSAKENLIGKMIDDMNHLQIEMEKLEIKIEKMKRMKCIDDKVNIEFSGIQLAEVEHKIECQDNEVVKVSFNEFYDETFQSFLK